MYFNPRGDENDIVDKIRQYIPKEETEIHSWLRYLEDELWLKKDRKKFKAKIVRHLLTDETLQVVDSINFLDKFYVIGGRGEFVGNWVDKIDCD